MDLKTCDELDLGKHKMILGLDMPPPSTPTEEIKMAHSKIEEAREHV